MPGVGDDHVQLAGLAEPLDRARRTAASPTSAWQHLWPAPGSSRPALELAPRRGRPGRRSRRARERARASASPIPRDAPVTSTRVPDPICMAGSSPAAILRWPHVPRQATVAEEEYLQIIYWLQEAGLPITGPTSPAPCRCRAPTVHEMVGRLEPDGYVTRNDDKIARFHRSGHEHAARIVRRHRLIERFLTDVFDIPWDQVHEEAERLEHWMSPLVEERMLTAIGDAKTCPHGHPIFEGAREEGVPLADVEEGASVRILRFENEAEDLLHYLKDSGLDPGLEGTLATRATKRSWSSRTAPSSRSPAAWPRRSRSSPTRRRRRAPPCRTSSCWAASATAGKRGRVRSGRRAAASGRARSRLSPHGGRAPGGAAGRRRRAARQARRATARRRSRSANGRRRARRRGGAGRSLQRRGRATSGSWSAARSTRLPRPTSSRRAGIRWPSTRSAHRPPPRREAVVEELDQGPARPAGATPRSGSSTGAQGATHRRPRGRPPSRAADAGWDVEADGLIGAPPVRVLVGEECHATIDRALGCSAWGPTRSSRSV